MEKLFHLNILTQERVVYAGYISSLIAPGELGYLGVLANHISLITNLVPGKINIKDDSGKQVSFSSKGKGFLEVLRNETTMLLEEVE